MGGSADPFFIEISDSHISIGSQEFCLPNKMISLILSQLVHQKSLHMLYEHYLEQIKYA